MRDVVNEAPMSTPMERNTHGRKLDVYCQREPWFFNIKFWLRETTWSPERITHAVALPFTFKTLSPEDEGMIPPESFSLSTGDAQAFMDELWRVGLRPTEGSGSAGSLAATERHLQDMRALVFKTDPPKP